MLFIAPYSTCMVKNKYSFFHTVIWVFILRNTLSFFAIFLHTLSHCIFHNRQSSRWNPKYFHYSDVIMSVMTSQIPGVSLVQTFLSVSVSVSVCVCVCVCVGGGGGGGVHRCFIWWFHHVIEFCCSTEILSIVTFKWNEFEPVGPIYLHLC